MVERGSRRTVVLAARVSPGTGPEAGTPIMFADGLDIGSDGTVYFTDAVAIAPPRLPGGGYDAMAVAVEALLEVRMRAYKCSWRSCVGTTPLGPLPHPVHCGGAFPYH